jgi:hypothetical protein
VQQTDVLGFCLAHGVGDVQAIEKLHMPGLGADPFERLSPVLAGQIIGLTKVENAPAAALSLGHDDIGSLGRDNGGVSKNRKIVRSTG